MNAICSNSFRSVRRLDLDLAQHSTDVDDLLTRRVRVEQMLDLGPFHVVERQAVLAEVCFERVTRGEDAGQAWKDVQSVGRGMKDPGPLAFAAGIFELGFADEDAGVIEGVSHGGTVRPSRVERVIESQRLVPKAPRERDRMRAAIRAMCAWRPAGMVLTFFGCTAVGY